jgi:hypothetical protein
VQEFLQGVWPDYVHPCKVEAVFSKRPNGCLTDAIKSRRAQIKNKKLIFCIIMLREYFRMENLKETDH